jgi:hypothetical protein
MSQREGPMNPWNAADLRDHFNERAGILEFDAGMSRPEAEARAMAELLEMLAGKPNAPNAPNARRRRSGNSDPEKRRAYQRQLMRRRRATRRARVNFVRAA